MTARGPRLILASASPRRREMLERIGLSFEVLPVRLDERIETGEAADAATRRLAGDKARAASRARPDCFVLAADTVVVLGERILGKPRDADDAAAMLDNLSGREHRVVTGYAATAPGAEPSVAHSESRVRFKTLTADEIAWYVDTGEPLDKAGAYAIQGRAAALVEAVHGSYTNVVGLPLAEALALLRSVGWSGRPGERETP